MGMKWISRWFDEIASKPSLPGVWRRRAGGYRIRGRTTSPKTGKLVEVNLALPDAPDAAQAYSELQRLLAEVRQPRAEQAERLRFREYAGLLLKRKVATGEILSAKTREGIDSIVRLHLNPAFGDYFLDAIRRADIEEWREAVGVNVQAGLLAPTTANNWLTRLRTILNAAVDEFELPKNPVRGVKNFDVRAWCPYTAENPNSLLPDEVPRYLEKMRALYPQHYAYVVLGFATGLRPSSLRPLRRSGPDADVKWSQGLLLVRRSHTRHQEVMDTTKQGTQYEIALPDELVEILRWHVTQLRGEMADSNLLFPSETGGLRSPSALDKPFREVANAMELEHPVTPRAMRRTYQDLMRRAQVHDTVTRSISGHATAAMQEHYSTASREEQREAIGRVLSLAQARARKQGSSGEACGVASLPERPMGRTKAV
jgi:integrase